MRVYAQLHNSTTTTRGPAQPRELENIIIPNATNTLSS